ncbi:histidine kinase [Amycolatopsis roodepoortensis]|uniref:sensor histidine kinase n=1 Tax=Amycolatopsis roodepoortensis TaxID=700274 RepID=UPI00214CD382|nr:histidine kinase [Amycolatopsis roodepoortensis]UUV28208.1 histidine kinase [Amycolatopsis roodepoortensis]
MKWLIRSGAVAAWLAVSALLVVGTANLEPGLGERPVDAFGFAVVSLACLALAVAWRLPVAAAGTEAFALLLYLGIDYPDGPVLFAGLVPLFALGTLRPRRLAYAVAGGMAVIVVGANLTTGGAGVLDLVFVGWAGFAVFAADALRARRERAAAAERAERERVLGERLRIAQDLHDSVGHAMAVINVQSGMAEHVIDDHPEVAKEALGVVRTVSGTILDELNAMVRLLREDSAPLRPAPGVADIPALVASANQAGLAVTLDLDAPGIGQPVGGAVYRILQESLTNAAKHGAPSAEVTVRADENGVRLDVFNEIHASGPDVPGAGITGMGERARATGGTLSAGREDGRFRVSARWP